MRELKFRAWDVKAEQMSDPFVLFGEFTLLGAVHEWQRQFGIPGDSLGRLNDLEILQFTGLKDKNGKDIYEGDLIIQDRIKGQVIYSRNGFYVEWTQNMKARITLGSPHPNEENNFETKCEVIGNIYENPNLCQ